MAKRIKKIGNPSFGLLKESGRVVPRDKDNYIIESFIVGNEYTVSNEDATEVLTVVCTQDMPTHLKVK